MFVGFRLSLVWNRVESCSSLSLDRSLDVRLRRWIDTAGRGWYSGDTHVHRTLSQRGIRLDDAYDLVIR